MDSVPKKFVKFAIDEVKRNKVQLKALILDPVAASIIDQLFPFMIGGIIYFISTFIMFIILIVLVLK